VRGRNALLEVARRIEADVRTLMPSVNVRVNHDTDGMLIVEVRDDDGSWGYTGTWIEDQDEEVSDADLEHLVVKVASEVGDNLWPDELMDPWPVCPRHRDHPLEPTLFRGRASWACRRDPSVAITIGSLASP
jgi:hypothetical protein